MDWNQALAMIRAGHDVEHVLDLKSDADNQEFRAFLLKEGGREALARYDARIKDLDSGVYGARMAWHSISGTQRRVLTACGQHAGRVARSVGQCGKLSKRFYGCGLIPGALLSTIRALCAHNLLAWDGGAFDPEAAAVLTERGRFVLRHGQTEAKDDAP